MNAPGHRLISVVGLTLMLSVGPVVSGCQLESTPGRVTERPFEPQALDPVDPSGDPRAVLIGFIWPEDGYCTGQFHAKATETSTQVRVGTVISRLDSSLACAGIGSKPGDMVWVPLILSSTIGSRAVVRDDDGLALPVYVPFVRLPCQSAFASEADPSPDLSVIFSQVALPLRTPLQATSSGERDPSARLFAKAGLSVVSGASFDLIVPVQWASRLTIGWGSPATRTIRVHVSGCNAAASNRPWLVFAGGFWIAEPACVPLLVSTGDREQTVQLGLGVTCPGKVP
jgi:hypothetical protein